MAAAPRRRDLVEILDAHERSIKRLGQTLARSGGGGGGVTDHGALTGLGDDDHTQYWNDTRGDAKIATHTADVDAHHSRYTDAEASALIATHTAIAGAHHSRYLDSEAVSAMGVKGDSNALHHDRYTDAEAAAKIAADDLYVKIAGDTMSGVLNMGTNFISGLATPALAADAATKGYADGILALHEADVDAHHTRYTDAEADARAALQDHDHATPIASHAAFPAAHHIRYTDGEADARIALASIDDLADVALGSLVDGQTLTWDTTNGWQNETPGSGVTDHGLLTGLADNDHPQYALLSGATFTGQVTVPNGTAAAPGLKLTSVNHGLYQFDVSNVGIAAAGSAAMIISSSAVTIMGTKLYFNGTTGHEFLEFVDASNYARIVLDNTEVWRVDTTSGGFVTTEVLKANNEVQLGGGSAGDPSLTFILDGDTGLYNSATNEIGFAAGAVNVWRMNSGGSLYSTASGGRVYTGDGTTGAPAHNFYNDQDTGMFRAGGNTIGFSAGNTYVAAFNTTGLVMIGSYKVGFSGSTAPYINESWGIQLSGDSTHPVRVINSAFLVGVTSYGGTFTAGYIYHAPPTTGSSANASWQVASGSIYYMLRSTSARKYKTDIDYDYPLADYELRPTKHWRIDDEEWYIGLVADDLGAQNPLFVDYDGDGEVENYRDRAVLSILAAKSNRADDERGKMRAEITRLKAKVKKLAKT